MHKPDSLGTRQGRLRAVLSCGLLVAVAGCASSGTTPLGASLQALWPDRQATAEQAEALPYASLSARLGAVEGLLVMGAEAGAMSVWPAPRGVVLELHDGGLHAFTGLDQTLLGTDYGGHLPWRQPAPQRFTLARHWQDEHGQARRGEARGQMNCREAALVELPLGERMLERCDVTLAWASGETTQATWWRDPDDRELWAVNETPWPGAPTIRWQVARHWW